MYFKTILVVLTLILTHSICFASKSNNTVILVAEVPEWLGNEKTIISKTLKFLNSIAEEENILARVMPTKRSLNVFGQNEFQCYLPTSPQFINNFTKTKRDDLIFLPLNTVNLQRFVLKANKNKEIVKRAATVRVSEKVTQMIKDINELDKVIETKTESIGIELLRKKRIDSLYIWGVSKLAYNAKDLYIIPNSSIISLDVGLVCINNEKNMKLLEKVQKKLNPKQEILLPKK